jgi:tRNA threonylcarbamoyladenosine biosynthesis protein TsaE
MSTLARQLTSVASTEQFAAEVAKTLKPAIASQGLTLGLLGGLGGGKTTFTRALVAALGDKEQVSSPTFVLCHEYAAYGKMRIEHWDIYRLKGFPPEELFEPPTPNTLRVVEWLDRFPELLPQAAATITFTLSGEEERSVVTWQNHAHPGAALWRFSSAT